MKYRIEYRVSRYEGELGKRYVVQGTGGSFSFHEFDAVDDADAQAKAPAEWRAVIAKAREAKLRSVGFVGLEHVPDATPVAVEWTPAAA
jgi:hypothetical protein